MDHNEMEMIAEVVSDIQSKRYSKTHYKNRDQVARLIEEFMLLSNDKVVHTPIVNATEIFTSAMADKKPWNVYKDFDCIAPPWPGAFISFVNTFGNVFVSFMASLDVDSKETRAVCKRTWEGDKPVDWERVRWAITMLIWIGGNSNGKRFPTRGPVYIERFLVYEDGSIADVQWVEIEDGWHESEASLLHLRVNLSTLDFMNCKNVDIVETAPRDRAQRRRLDRMGPNGIRVSTVNVFSTGKLRRGSTRINDSEGVPIRTVRGHFAKYGEKYGRQKLFGKLEGRFWVPKHAQGSKELGEIKSNYNLKTSEKD
jgi:hypothetical protein